MIGLGFTRTMCALVSSPFKIMKYAILCGLFIFSGCQGCSFDQVTELKDIRILGMRTEPAEIIYSGLYILRGPGEEIPFVTLPEYEMDVEVFAFDPRGGLLTSTMQLCPLDADTSCREYDPVEDLADVGDDERASLEAAYLPIERSERIEFPTTDRPSGQLMDMHYHYDFDVPVMDSIMYDDDGNLNLSPFSLLPRFVMDLTNEERGDVSQERAYKRVPITLNYNDPDLPVELRDAILSGLGITVCEEGVDRSTFEESITDCWLDRGPNQNPAFIGFNLVDENDLLQEFNPSVYGPDGGVVRTTAEVNGLFYAETSQLGPTSLIRANPGATLYVRPVLKPDSREIYQVYGFDLDDQSLTIQNRWEDFAVNWYSTRGQVPDLTTGQFQESLDAEWSLPFDVEPGERDTIVMMMRDQRGGLAMGQITVEYR